MAWPGFFQFGGTEIINASRTEAYAQHLNVGWFKPVYRQPDLAWLLGDVGYATPLQDDAPWVDSDNLDSFDFMGVYPLEITGIEDSTTSVEVTESVIDGGYIGKARHNTRAVVFSAVLVGLSECSVEYGLRWLRAVLAGSPCFGKTYGVCGGADLCYLSCFPAIDEVEPPLVPGPIGVDSVNLAMNPGGESGVIDGWHTNDAAKWALNSDTTVPIAGLRSILSTRQAAAPVVVATNPAQNPNLEAGSLNGWTSGQSSSYALTSDATSPITGTRSAMTTRQGTLTTTVSALSLFSTGTTRFPASAGVPFTFGVDVKTELAARRVRLSIGCYDAGGTLLGDFGGAFVVNNTNAGQVYRAVNTITPPANTATCYLSVQVFTMSGNATLGERVWVDNLRVGGDGSYFDGNTPAGGGFTYRWTGAVNASTSEQLGSVMTDPVAASLYLTQSAAGAFPLMTGDPITAALDVKVELAGRRVSGQLSWLDQNGTSIGTTTAVTATPAAGAVTRLLMTGPPPAGASFVRPMVVVDNPSGASVAGERVWFDNLYVGLDASGAYFDGSTADTDTYSYVWTGDPNASTSQRLVQTYVAGPSQTPTECYDKVGRSLHEVTVTTGPTVTAKMEMTDGGTAWTVTWTMVAANPAEFGVERPLIVGFLDPAVEIPYYGGVVPPGGTFDPDGYVQTEESCPITVYNPIFDPLCALLVPPPDVPTVVPTCFSFPTSFTRRSFTIPRDNVPLWTEVVPLVQLTTGASEARNVRLRFYADVFNTGSPDQDPCNFCGDVVFSYIPPGSTIVLDGMDQAVYVDQPGQGRRRADSLVSDSTGNPFEWPQFSCGFGYVVTVDTPQTAKNLPIVDLSLVPRTL